MLEILPAIVSLIKHVNLSCPVINFIWTARYASCMSFLSGLRCLILDQSFCVVNMMLAPASLACV